MANKLSNTFPTTRQAVVGPNELSAMTNSNFTGLGTTVTGIEITQEVNGENLFLSGKFTTPTDATSAATPGYIILPDGLTIDTTNKTTLVSSFGTLIRLSIAADIGNTANMTFNLVLDTSAGSDRLLITSDASAGLYVQSNTNAQFTNSNILEFSAKIPIAEWVGKNTLNTGKNDIEYAYNSNSDNTNDTTSFAYGLDGVLFPNRAVGVTCSKTVQFQTEIQPTDVYELQYTDGNGRWQSADSRFPYTRASTQVYGYDMYQTSSTTIVVRFAAGGFQQAGATYGSTGTAWSTAYTNGWKWRVVKHKSNVPVGFGLASSTATGLVKKNKWQKKHLTTNDTTGAQITADMDFSGLTVGKTYKLKGQVLVALNNGSADVYIDFKATHDGATVCQAIILNRQTSSTAGDNFSAPLSATFTATATTLTFSAGSISGQSYVLGVAGGYYTYAILEECDNLEETSEW